MGKRLLDLGIVIDYVLTHSIAKNKSLLERVFSEQYEKSDDGVVSVRDKRKSQPRACRTRTIPMQNTEASTSRR